MSQVQAQEMAEAQGSGEHVPLLVMNVMPAGQVDWAMTVHACVMSSQQTVPVPQDFLEIQQFLPKPSGVSQSW